MNAQRKPYVIASKSRYLCVTCRATIKTRREALKHECPPEPETVAEPFAYDPTCVMCEFKDGPHEH